jgi:hypothetical protein
MKDKHDALLELCRCLLPEDPTLEQEVQLSINQPDAFLSQIKRTLRDWVDDELIEVAIPWYTLIHGLYQRGLVFEFSARHTAETMDFAANQLFSELQQDSLCAASPDTMHFVDTFLSLTSEYLLRSKYTLAEIRLPSGITALTIVPHSTADQCAALIERSGYGEFALYPSTTTQQTDHPLSKQLFCEPHVKASSLPV